MVQRIFCLPAVRTFSDDCWAGQVWPFTDGWLDFVGWTEVESQSKVSALPPVVPSCACRKQGSEEDEALVPVAIEIAHPDTPKDAMGAQGKGGVVYTPKPFQHPEEIIWRLVGGSLWLFNGIGHK